MAEHVTPDDMPLGQYLRLEREREGLSIRDLAERTGRDRGHISRIESGATPHPGLEVLYDFAVALDLSYRDLVRRSGQKLPPETRPELAEYLREEYDLDTPTAHKLAGQFQQVIKEHRRTRRADKPHSST
jgi:transcriptional regulator with XRE-family HTH domain